MATSSRHTALACLLLLLALPALAQEGPAAADFAAQHPGFDAYWYQGLAELDRYRVEQARYGEVHAGESVMIYVTEDFLSDAHVKWDHGDRTNAVPVLKLNNYARFNTGIYPYTVMTSVFTPIAAGPTMKLATSVTEWCGMAYSQLNLSDEGYRLRSHSYFQSEGDRDESLPTAILEDELWVRGRQGPGDLPVGELQMIPSMAVVRLMHQRPDPVTVSASLETLDSTAEWSEPVTRYTVAFPDGRHLQIDFESAFPHRPVAWEQTARALFSRTGGDPPELTSTGVLTHSVMLDYWNRNQAADARLRDLLGLEF